MLTQLRNMYYVVLLGVYLVAFNPLCHIFPLPYKASRCIGIHILVLAS